MTIEWNHDVQLGFVCGVFVGVVGLAVMFFALDLLTWLVAGRKRQPRGNGGRGQ